MDKNCHTYQAYVDILRRELVPAMGCTEPIAIAYCAAKARAALGTLPDQITVAASGNPAPVLSLLGQTASAGYSFVPATGVLTYTAPGADLGARPCKSAQARRRSCRRRR